MRLFFTLLILFVFSVTGFAQVIVSGTVLDNSKINYVEGVRVVSTSGKLTFTDTLGRFSISASPNDSLFFVYNNKPTQKFSVDKIPDLTRFEISLGVPVKSKYSVLKEVVVYAKSYGRDSLENRENYADVFAFRKQGIQTSIAPGGTVGLDANELINLFRFKRNKRLKSFQLRLEAQEAEKYVDYRFSKRVVQRITNLTSPMIDSFLVKYRPSYPFTISKSEIEFNQYIIESFYEFQNLNRAAEAKKP